MTEYRERISVVSCTGDIRNIEDLQNAIIGVNFVIHAAAAVDFRMFPDIKFLEHVNVLGTANVISVCITNGITNLVFTSTVDAVVGFKDIINGDETLPYPEEHLFRGYGTTKQMAEELVLAANGQALAKGSGNTLRCIILRPTVMFGECDPYFITTVLKNAEKCRGLLYRIGSGQAVLQCTYAGNVAWAHVCALRALESGDLVAGKIYTITDDTPVKNTFDTMEPFLRVRGYRASSFRIPFKLMYGIFYMLHWVIQILRHFYKFNMPIAMSAIQCVDQSVYFSRSLAENRLKYQPKYMNADSIKNSLKFYGKVILK